MKRIAAVLLLAVAGLGCTASAQMLRMCSTECPPGWVCYRPGCVPVYGNEPRPCSTEEKR